MFALRFFTILSCREDTDWIILELAKTLHEQLKVFVIETVVAEVIVVVSQGDKGVFFVHLRFVNAADGPLTAVVETAL